MQNRKTIKKLKKINKLLKQTKKFIKIENEEEREQLVKNELIKIENIIEEIITKPSNSIFSV